MATSVEFEGYLKQVAQIAPRSHEAFVLQYGRQWSPSPRPKGMRKRKDGLCFMNSAHLILNGIEDGSLTYVEGFAFNIIPTLHAWCVTPDGAVVDPTWRDPEKSLYFGVPFKREYLMKVLCERRYYGLIDNPQNGWPLLTGDHPPSLFLDTRFSLPSETT